MRIDAYSSRPHYADHIRHIFDSLPDDIKGKFFVDQNGVRLVSSDSPVIVASFDDLKLNFHRPCIYVEHGAGQHYVGIDRAVAPYYSGGKQHRNVALFLCPNEEVQRRWKDVYPDKPAVVVGCPRLDPWHIGDRGAHEDRTVAITFHWPADFTGVPETMSAFGEYFKVIEHDVIGKWRSEGWHIIGHAHPRYPALADFWQSSDIRNLGVEYVAESADVLDRATILVADNTSLQAEFLSLGRRVVWLNHSLYRRNVEHGGRFWNWPTLGGVQIDTPSDLAHLNLYEIPATTGHPYAYADGHATERAVEAILSLDAHG